jgi:hypothetical protein
MQWELPVRFCDRHAGPGHQRVLAGVRFRRQNLEAADATDDPSHPDIIMMEPEVDATFEDDPSLLAHRTKFLDQLKSHKKEHRSPGKQILRGGGH